MPADTDTRSPVLAHGPAVSYWLYPRPRSAAPGGLAAWSILSALMLFYKLSGMHEPPALVRARACQRLSTLRMLWPTFMLFPPVALIGSGWLLRFLGEPRTGAARGWLDD